eukprot:TRINITY_DN18956_c0_g1::TRINITY_DN18956_c0_g1_i1::g.21638::m.21638 TRINITY_DN18956_c0_g1::TRINITY_DN18956_c0_g1_i1::g.21638  ORF type:complete len:117 (-),score=21.94,Rdx/PF10262.4/9e-05 TRINITY_DN18956_c0_g1_i1:187-537(-)
MRKADRRKLAVLCERFALVMMLIFLCFKGFDSFLGRGTLESSGFPADELDGLLKRYYVLPNIIMVFLVSHLATSTGNFDVYLEDGRLLFSKKKENRLPEKKDIENLKSRIVEVYGK